MQVKVTLESSSKGGSTKTFDTLLIISTHMLALGG